MTIIEAVNETSTGPDLQHGIPVSALADGGMIAGHASAPSASGAP